MTYPFLDRLRVIESSAFIAAPLAGLTLAQRFEPRDAIARLLEPWFAARTRPEVEALLQRHKVCWGATAR